VRSNLIVASATSILLVACGGNDPESLGPPSFVSDGGRCHVILTTAEVATVEGTFSCTGITDENGSIVVNAQGTFSAKG
jgi:hypothetical protein